MRSTASRFSSRALAAAVCVAMAVCLGAQQPATPAQRVEDRLRALQSEADALASQQKTLLGELRQLEIERQQRAAELTQIERELASVRAQLAAATRRAAALHDVAETGRPEVEARLVHLYKLGRAGYWRLLLDARDARAVGRAYRTAAALTRIDRERIHQHQRTVEALERERAALEARAREMAALQQQAAAARAALDRAVASRTALVASIDARRDLNAQLTGELQAAQQRLDAALNASTTARAAVSLPLRPFRGALPWPAPGVVIGRFGSRRAGGAARNGIEISLAEGRPVRAVHEGTVAFADAFTGYGNLVIVDHGENSYSLYGHLGSLDVKPGARVDAQARLGASGRNPSGNPALYFELRIDAKPVDPLQWLER